MLRQWTWTSGTITKCKIICKSTLLSYNLFACASVQKLAHGPFMFIVHLLCHREPESMIFSWKVFLTFKHSFSLQNQKAKFRLSRCRLQKIMVWQQHKVEEAVLGNGAAWGTWSSTCFQLQATHLALPPCQGSWGGWNCKLSAREGSTATLHHPTAWLLPLGSFPVKWVKHDQE